MDIARAFTYTFDDEDWVGKVVMIVVWTFIAAIPLIGLIGAAALAGYVVELVRNMQRGETNPLPRWDNVGDKIMSGANVLIAAFVYNLGNMLLICSFVLLMPILGGGGDVSATSTVSLAIGCCLSIFLFIYNLIIWPLLAVGTVFYARSNEISAFFQMGRIYGTINRHMGLTVQWMLFVLLAGFVLGLFNAVPCIGWIASLALTMPIHGHLLGQFGARIDDKPKSKPKPQPRRVGS
ncbi:MAG: DUF4013 domain-containing protein [Anaerolineae bacterium]|nr:DUF4013 domain-containing protein [Anaerolineae bacterium]